MELRAPGTDDKSLFTLTSQKKQDERTHFLNLKAVLADSNRYENIFEVLVHNGKEQWYCRACRCGVDESPVQHENGVHHKSRINWRKTSAIKNRQKETEQKFNDNNTKPVEIAHDKPVPRGFEDQIKRVAKIQEDERNCILKTKAVLTANNQYEYVFEVAVNNGSEVWFCRACHCTVNGHPLQHEILKSHKSRINWPKTIAQIAIEGREKESGQDPNDANTEPVPMDIAPGEPVPPGFEDKVEGVAVIQEKLDAFKLEPLIGLEYVLEIEDIGSFLELEYLCILCGKRGNPGTIINHLTSNNHLRLYIVKHFPKCSKILYRYRGNTSFKNYQKTVQKIAEAIEAKYGRLKAYAVPKEKFEKDQTYYTRMIINGKHFSEDLGYTFEDIVLQDELEENKKKGENALESEDKSYWTDYYKQQLPTRETQKRASSPKKQDTEKKYKDTNSNKSNKSPRYASQKRSLSPEDRLPHKSTETVEERIRKIEEFRKLSRAIENDMQNTLKKQIERPENHPQYKKEWKLYWKTRVKELQVAGVDTTKYDFKPEWIIFWNKRMVELHSDELRSRKEALRKRLDLPEEKDMAQWAKGASNLSVESKNVYERERNMKRSLTRNRNSPGRRSSSRDRSKRREPVRRSRSRDRMRRKDEFRRSRDISPFRSRDMKRSPIWETNSRVRSPSRGGSLERRDRDYRVEYRESSFEKDLRNRSRVRTVADLPWERPVADLPPWERDPWQRNPAHYHTSVHDDDDNDDSDVNAVGVLRLLAALEEHLGSLGTKVVDLLAQALSMEKNEANSSEALMDMDINCIFFETVKEKLKGQLQARLVDVVQERAFRKAVKKVSKLMHAASKRKEAERLKSRAKALAVAGVGSVDRAAIAKQIATALIAQGKTDVTQTELEQLVNHMVGLAEASKTANKSATATSVALTGSPVSDFEDWPEQSENPKTGVSSQGELPQSVTPGRLLIPVEKLDTATDEDLQNMLQNFRILSKEDQYKIIEHLSLLEVSDPGRVENLRKFVDMDSSAKDGTPGIDDVKFKATPKTNSLDFNPPQGIVAGGLNIKVEKPDYEEIEDIPNSNALPLSQNSQVGPFRTAAMVPKVSEKKLFSGSFEGRGPRFEHTQPFLLRENPPFGAAHFSGHYENNYLPAQSMHGAYGNNYQYPQNISDYNISHSLANVQYPNIRGVQPGGFNQRDNGFGDHYSVNRFNRPGNFSN